MKNLKHYTFVFTNNDGVTITTMTMATKMVITMTKETVLLRKEVDMIVHNDEGTDIKDIINEILVTIGE